MTESSSSAMHAWPPFVRGCRAAFVFFTRLPVGGFPYRSEDFAWAPAYAPVVGAFVGCIGAIVQSALLRLGSLPAAVFAVGVTAVVTGAFHEDGLADTADALGGAATPDRVLSILKDSRIGTYGATALMISVLGRAALLAELGKESVLPWVVSGAWARVGPIWLLALLPYVTHPEVAKSGPVVGSGRVRAVVATGLALVVTFGLVAASGPLSSTLVTSSELVASSERVTSSGLLAAVLAAGVATAGTGYWYKKRMSGITGDFLGATEQISELLVLAALLWVKRTP